MTTYQVLYWHDIPVQVRAGGRRDRASSELPHRFQVAVDNAAMAASLTGTDAYLAGFEWSGAAEREGTPTEVVDIVVDELQTAHPTINWRATAEKIRDAKGKE